MVQGNKRMGSIMRLMSFLSTHAAIDAAQHTIFHGGRRTAPYLLCALTIPRSKCTLMDCIKQRDERAEGVEAKREVRPSEVARGWPGLGWSTPADAGKRDPAMADRAWASKHPLRSVHFQGILGRSQCSRSSRYPNLPRRNDSRECSLLFKREIP